MSTQQSAAKPRRIIWIVLILFLLAGVGGYFASLEQADKAPVQEAQDPVVAPAATATVLDNVGGAEIPETKSETVDVSPTEIPQIAPEVIPSIDEVRIEADGLAVIAGQGAAGAQIVVLLDGQEIARAEVDGNGKFAAISFLPQSADARILSLLQVAGDVQTASTAEVILAPIEAPAGVAQAGADAPEAQKPAPVQEQQPTLEAAAEDAAPQIAQVDTVPSDTTANIDAGTAPAPQPVEAKATEDGVQIVQVQQQTPAIAQETAAAPSEQAPVQNTAIAVLKSTEDGVELLQAGNEAVSSVTLDTIGYSQTGDVRLSGRAERGTRQVRLYLDNTLVDRFDVDADGKWRGDLRSVLAGDYALRVDALAADGSVLSRVETPLRREAPEVLAAAAANSDRPISAITVQKGNTLWAIARARYGDGMLFVKVFEANKNAIRDPDLIYPGQVFDLPD
mgnify:CR=1 FL=1